MYKGVPNKARRSEDRKSILFYRDFRRYSGGHQKVADYFAHCRCHKSVEPAISFSASTKWDQSNPWLSEKNKQVSFVPRRYDYLFLGGVDWRIYLAAGIDPSILIINLIQGVRHADPSSNVYSFLRQKAIRICVSQEVSDAILATGQVKGPVFTIANGHHIPAEPLDRVRDVYILGHKQPKLATALAERLQQQRVQVLVTPEHIPLADVHYNMATSRISVVLPQSTEGFYLPGLEAMALSDIAVVPDCIGNRSFCLDEMNCLMPALTLDALQEAINEALDVLSDKDETANYRREAELTVARHSLERERREFYRVMEKLPSLWRES